MSEGVDAPVPRRVGDVWEVDGAPLWERDVVGHAFFVFKRRLPPMPKAFFDQARACPHGLPCSSKRALHYRPTAEGTLRAEACWGWRPA